MNESDLVCEVCGGSVSRADAALSKRRGHVVCRSGECQGLLAQRATMDPVAYEAHFALQRRLIRQRAEREVRWKAHEAVVDSAEEEDNRRILEAVLRDRGREGTVELVVIPTGLSRMVPMTADRRMAYRANLEEAIEEAGSCTDLESMPRDQRYAARVRAVESEALLAANPDLRVRCDTLCGMCKGGCCSTGGDTAFITAVTIRRVLDADPALTPQTILETYRARVPDESVEEACIHQTATGCALPREWRSDVCNGYFCGPLVEHQKASTGKNRLDPLLVIRRANHNWNRYLAETANPVMEVAWMDGERAQPVDVEIRAAGAPAGEEPPPAVELSETRDNRRVLEAVGNQLEEGRAPPVVGIPSGRAHLVSVPAERRDRYRANLEEAAAEAATYADLAAMPDDERRAARARNLESEAFLRERPALQRRSDHLCDMCKGGCCIKGGEHAFVSAVTVRRLLDADPTLTPEGVVATYLRHLPAHAIEGACINQTETGCALPRAWRSDVCNGYFCPSLTAYQEGWDGGARHDPVLVIRRNYHGDDRIIRSAPDAVEEVAVVDDDGVRPLVYPCDPCPTP